VNLKSQIGDKIATSNLMILLPSPSTRTLNSPGPTASEVAGVFSQKLHIDVPAYDSDLFEAGILDSLQLVELLFELEHQFGVRISLGESDLEDFRSIERITLMLNRKNDNGSRAEP